MQNYNGGWALILIAIAEVVVFAWIYGTVHRANISTRATPCKRDATSHDPVSVSVCLSVICLSDGVLKRDERINVVFTVEAFFDQS